MTQVTSPRRRLPRINVVLPGEVTIQATELAALRAELHANRWMRGAVTLLKLEQERIIVERQELRTLIEQTEHRNPPPPPRELDALYRRESFLDGWLSAMRWIGRHQAQASGLDGQGVGHGED